MCIRDSLRAVDCEVGRRRDWRLKHCVSAGAARSSRNRERSGFPREGRKNDAAASQSSSRRFFLRGLSSRRGEDSGLRVGSLYSFLPVVAPRGFLPNLPLCWRRPPGARGPREDEPAVPSLFFASTRVPLMNTLVLSTALSLIHIFIIPCFGRDVQRGISGRRRTFRNYSTASGLA